MPADATLVLLVALFLLSAFFSGSETAVFSLDLLARAKVGRLQTKTGRRLTGLLQRSHGLLLTILIGNTLANTALSSVASDFFTNELLAVAVITLALLIFGEVTPKNLAFAFNRRFSLLAAFPLTFFGWLLAPLRRVFRLLTRPVVERYTETLERRASLTAAEIKTAVVDGHREGVFGSSEKGLLSNVLDFSMKDARHIMTPRTRIKALPEKSTLKETVAFARESGVSKIPIYRRNRDNIVGYLRVKDLLPYIRGVRKATGIGHLIRPVLRIPEGRGLADFFPEMQRSTSRVVVVLDEYGGTAGILTLDDVLEEVFGQLLDEDERLHRHFWKAADGRLLFRGSAPLSVFNEETGADYQSGDYETLGGYLLELAGDIPKQGDELADARFRFRIGRMSGQHISLVEVARRDA